MNKVARTWSLMSACWKVLIRDKELLLFPLISGFCCLLLLASFAIPLYATNHWRPPVRDTETARQVAYYGALFVFYVCNYFVVVFFNAAIVSCAITRLTGGDPTLGDGLRAAGSRLPAIAGWALVSATVGLLLRLIEDRSKKVGAFVAGLLGAAWTLVSFLVVPIMVIENKNPIVALKESTAFLKRTWGEQVIGNFSFGLVFGLLSLPALLLVLVAILSGNGFAIAAAIGLVVIYLVLLALIQSALQSILQAALFLYARDGQVPSAFNAELLGSAISQR